ncbi:MAG: ATP-binding protein [Candidatus Aminicenantaceae bacterium]
MPHGNRSRASGIGKEMGKKIQRILCFSPARQPISFDVPPAGEKPISRDQKIAVLREQERILEKQIKEINTRIQMLEEEEPTSSYIAEIDQEKCIQCYLCTSVCPTDAITNDKGSLEIDREKCTGCGLCVPECPRNAISLQKA